MPILEWSHVKNFTGTNAAVEEVGCWTVLAPFTEHRHAVAPTPPVLKLGEVYTPVPPFCRLKYKAPFATFQGLSTILLPSGRKEALANPEAATKHTKIATLKDSVLDADDHLVCFAILP